MQTESPAGRGSLIYLNVQRANTIGRRSVVERHLDSRDPLVVTHQDMGMYERKEESEGEVIGMVVTELSSMNPKSRTVDAAIRSSR